MGDGCWGKGGGGEGFVGGGGGEGEGYSLPLSPASLLLRFYESPSGACE